jgi:hypothetical protein
MSSVTSGEVTLVFDRQNTTRNAEPNPWQREEAGNEKKLATRRSWQREEACNKKKLATRRSWQREKSKATSARDQPDADRQEVPTYHFKKN